MKKLMLLTGLVLIFLSPSCKKSDSGQYTGACRMSKAVNSEDIQFCYYDENHNISKMMFIEQDTKDTSWENYYYENGHVRYLIRLYKGNSGDTIIYTYESGKYVQVNQYGEILKYYYDNANRLIKIETYFNSEINNYLDIVYDSRGNCTKLTWYIKSGNAFECEETDEYEYGDNKNPYYSIGLPPLNSSNPAIGTYLSPNNILIWRIHNPQLGMMTLRYNYTSFNENGYPVAFTIGDTLNNLLYRETIEYNCP